MTIRTTCPTLHGQSPGRRANKILIYENTLRLCAGSRGDPQGKRPAVSLLKFTKNLFLRGARLLFITVLVFAAFSANAATSDWKIVSTEASAELNSISCPEPRVCYATGGMYLSGGTGKIFRTEDGGVSFSRLTIPTLNPLHVVSCSTTRVCYAAGDFGTLLKTENGGELWTEYLLGSRANRPHLTGLFATDNEKVIVVSRDGNAFRTEDGGEHWTPLSLRVTADLYSVYFIGATTGFIAGNDGTLLKTEDGGQSWISLRGLKDAGLTQSIRGAGTESLLAVGDTIQKSIDRGKIWTAIADKNKMSSPYRSIAAASGSLYYSLSGANAIFKSEDGGASWTADAEFEGAFLRDIICPAADFCLAVGARGQVFKRGNAPEPPPPPPPPADTAAATTTAVATSTVEVSPTVQPSEQTNVAVAIPTQAPPPVAESVAPEAKKALSAAITFTRSLKRGFRGADVEKLQSLLAGAAGIYPEGEVTGFFGAATQKAVGRFQEQYGIANPGEPGYGEAGPKTRGKLIDFFKENGSTVAPAESVSVSEARAGGKNVSVIIVRNLKKGSRGDEVKKLQEALASDRSLYPEGDITGYFGSATARAVGRFQEKYGIAAPGEAGYGEVGPKTRAALQND